MTTDKTREKIKEILNPYIHNCDFLDAVDEIHSLLHQSNEIFYKKGYEDAKKQYDNQNKDND